MIGFAFEEIKLDTENSFTIERGVCARLNGKFRMYTKHFWTFSNKYLVWVGSEGRTRTIVKIVVFYNYQL